MLNYLTPNFDFVKITGFQPQNPLPCPDQVCGYILNGKYKSVRNRKIKYNIDYNATGYKTYLGKRLKSPVVVILESPHKEEFCKMCGMPIGPARGKTGNYFDEHFGKLIKNSSIYQYINAGMHAVVFVNAVQYQCSLGNSLQGKNNAQNRIICDKNWVRCFNGGCKYDLKRRVAALKPIAIINLCTKGKRNLRGIVQPYVNQIATYTYGNHPSSWWCKNCRIIN